MKGRGMKCVLIVMGVLTWWLSCLPYPCREHNRTPGSMPARPRRSFTPKKWFENCSSSNIAIKLVLGSGSELELEWFFWKKRNALKTSARARSQNCAEASDFRQSSKTPWKSPTSHLITTSFGWFLFCCFPRFPCDFIPSSMLPGHSDILSPSSSAPFQAWTAATMWPPWVDGKATVACRAGMKLEHSRYRFWTWTWMHPSWASGPRD